MRKTAKTTFFIVFGVVITFLLFFSIVVGIYYYLQNNSRDRVVWEYVKENVDIVETVGQPRGLYRYYSLSSPKSQEKGKTIFSYSLITKEGREFVIHLTMTKQNGEWQVICHEIAEEIVDNMKMPYNKETVK